MTKNMVIDVDFKHKNMEPQVCSGLLIVRYDCALCGEICQSFRDSINNMGTLTKGIRCRQAWDSNIPYGSKHLLRRYLTPPPKSCLKDLRIEGTWIHAD